MLTLEDFKALISPAAEPYLEQMAQLSRLYTQQRFGKVILLYIPMYLSNECSNHCIYCGFNHNNDIARKTLTDEEIMEEIKVASAPETPSDLCGCSCGSRLSPSF